MGHQDTTYVIFDADNDYWAYARMKGWRALRNIDFDFRNAHEINTLRDWSSETTVKPKLRERFRNSDQVIVLIGPNTRNLYRYVRWELDVALELDLSIIAVNLNGMRKIDDELCPPIIRTEFVVHIPFKMAIIKYAMDHFPDEFRRRSASDHGPRSYPRSVYASLGL